MTDRDTSTTSFGRGYRPWGQVRRKNMIARLMHGAIMTVIGLATLAGLALAVVFAASVAIVGAMVIGLATLFAMLRRTPVRVSVKAEKSGKAKNGADGLFEARKSGSTWIVY